MTLRAPRHDKAAPGVRNALRMSATTREEIHAANPNIGRRDLNRALGRMLKTGVITGEEGSYALAPYAEIESEYQALLAKVRVVPKAPTVCDWQLARVVDQALRGWR